MRIGSYMVSWVLCGFAGFREALKTGIGSWA